MNQSIVFFGTNEFTIPVVEKLLSHNLKLVVSNSPTEKLSEFCKRNNIPYIVSDLKNKDHIEMIQTLNPTVAILASYGAFVPNSVINSFTNGIINIHPSLLPKYKGPTPVQTAILDGATTTGVSLILLDDQIDHGPILSQKPYELQGNETSEDLLTILFEIGAEMVEEQIINLENGVKPTGTPQDHSKESWSYRITKKDGQIDMSSILDIEKLDQMVRAYYPWPGVWFRYQEIATSPAERDPNNDNTNKATTSPTVIASEARQSKLENKIIKLLPENRIQVEGKNPVTFKDFINGFGEEGKEILAKLNLI